MHTSFCKHLNCSKLLVLDGNWKCNRIKCAYEKGSVESSELGQINIGCVKSPVRNSYFCEDHQKHNKVLTFKGEDKAYTYDVKQIIPSKPKCKIVKIFDLIIDQNNEIIYFVSVEDGTFCFVNKKNVNDDKLIE